jgi:hypothetical protein
MKTNNPLTDTIVEQILAVRATAMTNMFDTHAVQRFAYEMDLYELVCFIEEDRLAYSRFILTGERDSKK